ncbi:unnamed protein product [Rhizoctonia solani]|uniref:Uncharacterized protein n=1 Tax=Rhizoctonia solani TaxID=456999 RepID=A0A8H3BI64_9AGAM|nr:unnamed protein product [Rhizoctonia solani]
MDPSDYDILQIKTGGIVSVRTAGFQALLDAKAKSRDLTSKSALTPLADDLVQGAANEERIVRRDFQEFGIRGATVHPAPGPSNTCGQQAPPPPEPGKAVTYDKYLKATYNSGDPHVREQHIELMKETLDKQFDPEGTTIGDARHRAHMVGLYHTFLKHHVPDLPVSQYWAESTICKWIELFLINLVQCSTGRQGLRIRTSTLRRWLTSLIPLIGRYTFNRQGEAVGANLLAGGFYLRLPAREKWSECRSLASYTYSCFAVMRNFKLNRYPGPRGYLSQRDLQAMFERGLEDTETFGRESFLQTHLAFVIVFHTAIRVSSLAACHPKYEEWGQYIKLEDLTIIVYGPGIWDVEIKVYHRKGQNQSTDPGYSLDFRLDAVSQVHNLVFDAGISLLCILLLRGALVGIETVDQLFAYKQRYIRIKPRMLKEPL